MTILEKPDLKGMDIGQLRHYASHLRVAVAKTATKKEILEALDRKLGGNSVPEFATEASKVKPGYAKIKLLSDPAPGASNYPVYLNCNGYTCTIPRDVEVIVPMKVVRTLTDATVLVRKQALVSDSNGRETFKETTVKTNSYPFQILEMVPGEEVLTTYEEGKRRTQGPKRKYRELFHRWPTPRELARALEQGIIKFSDNETVSLSTDALIEEAETTL